MNLNPDDVECLYSSENEIVLAILHLADRLDKRLQMIENRLYTIAEIADHYGAVYASQEV